MYIQKNHQTYMPGLRGFAQSPQDAYQKSLDAIRKALQLNPVGGYVKGSSARKQLEEAFESVPGSTAAKLGKRLLSEQGPLEKLFRYRLHTDTQKAMSLILVRKALQDREETRQRMIQLRKEAEEKERIRKELEQKLERKICETLKISEDLVNALCKRAGEDSDDCKQLRLDLRASRMKSRCP